MTIYHYLRDFPADESRLTGGLDKAVAGLARGLMQVDPDANCIILCEGPRATNFRHHDGFTVQCFDNSSTRNKRFGLAPALREFVLGEMRPQLIVLNAIFNPSVYLMSRLLRQRGFKYIVAPHDPYHPAMFASGRLKKSLYWHLCERPMLQHAAAVQVLDQRHEKFLRARSVTTPVVEVGNGFSPDELPDESTLRWSADGPIRLLFLGRLDPVNKGLDLLIDAFALLAPRFPQLRLTLQGPDRGEGAIVRAGIASHNLRDRVEMLPPDFVHRAGELAALHDLLILPSRFEGFGLSAMEGMLAGRPVIVSDIAGLSPHVRRADGGIVVDATVESIRLGIEQMIGRRSEWKAIGMRGRDYIVKNLTWPQIAAGAMQRYRELV